METLNAVNEPAKIMKIFIPHNCCIAPSGILLGTVDVSSASVCISGIYYPPLDSNYTPDKWIQAYESNNTDNDSSIRIVGIWQNESAKNISDLVNISSHLERLSLNWIFIKSLDSGDISCSARGNWKNLNCASTVFIFVYDCDRLIRSGDLMIEKQLKPHLSTLIGCIWANVHLDMLNRISCGELKWFFQPITEQQNLLECALVWMPRKVLSFTEMVWTILSRTFSRCPGNEFVSSVIQLPASVSQVKEKYHQLKYAVGDNRRNAVYQHSRWNARFGIVLDVLIGIFIMVWLMRNDRHNQIAHTVITSALNLITELHRLLSWIMGFPAGLKLNNHLVQFLGKFFTYHNYLWTGYMHLLQPLLGRVLWYGSLFGCLGLSMQLSFTYDLLSMMTLHIYCFYVYAARLYSLEVSMLSSLFRLFRGKKWNVLRKRVDSASYDIDQLFIGTLLFTVLLFILPTLIVYYVAFTALRLLVVIIHGILCQIIHLLNTVPVASLLLRIICHSSLTIGDINFQVYRTTQQDDQHQIIMAMQVVQLSVSEIYRKYKQKTLVKKQTYSWSELIRRLSLGHIIYPWIPRAEDDADIMTPRASG